MGECGNCGGGAGPFSESRERVEFVYSAHGGAVKDQLIPNGGLNTNCQGCSAEFPESHLLANVLNVRECMQSPHHSVMMPETSSCLLLPSLLLDSSKSIYDISGLINPN